VCCHHGNRAPSCRGGTAILEKRTVTDKGEADLANGPGA
jgi:hypothetical protein